MNNPKLYQQSNNLQATISKEVVNNFIKFIKWNQNGDDDVIDVGCGTGNVTCEILYPTLPLSIKRVLAVDINPKMVKTAMETYLSYPKVEFGVLDMGSKIPANLLERFDHLFSFFCLHWIQDQKLVMKNIFDLLKPGGDALFVMPAKADQVYKNYEFMEKDPRFQKYMTNVTGKSLPYRNEEFPERALRNYLEDANLSVQICETVHKEFVFEDDIALRGFLESINPFVTKMPPQLQEEYMSIYLERVKNQDPKKIGEPTIFYIDVFIVCAKKTNFTICPDF